MDASSVTRRTPWLRSGAAWLGSLLGNVALAVLVANVAAVLVMLVSFSRCSRLAAWLVAPLLGWVCFAAALNAAIVALN